MNPLTHKRVLQADNVPYILAEMMMEGLYGRSGDWAYRVGLPGKSGVGGGILAVVPGVMGIAAAHHRWTKKATVFAVKNGGIGR